MRRHIAIIALGLVAAASAVPALANNGKGGGGGGSATTSDTSSITLNGAASIGSPLSFTVVDPPVKGYPEMSVSCFDSGGNYLYLEVQMLSGSSPYTPTFSLSSSALDSYGQDASCTASLFYYTWKGHRETGVVYLATTDFTASVS